MMTAIKDIKDQRRKMNPWVQGAWEKGRYPNVFLEAGDSRKEIDAKSDKADCDILEGPERVYFELGDSMAYVSDLKNHDARTEGLSYGMMAAVQLNKKEVFDRLWHWTKVYMHHQGGARDAYFARSVEPKTGKHNAEGYFDPHDDGLRYLFSLMHLSGNDPFITTYSIQKPNINSSSIRP